MKPVSQAHYSKICILSYMSSVHTLTHCLRTIILPSTASSPKLSLLCLFSDRKFVHFVCRSHAACPTRITLLYFTALIVDLSGDLSDFSRKHAVFLKTLRIRIGEDVSNLLRCFALSMGSSLPTFRNSVSVKNKPMTVKTSCKFEDLNQTVAKAKNVAYF
jgi:hypothetical protein